MIAPSAQDSHGRWPFSRAENVRLIAMYGFIALLHLAGWGLFLRHAGSFGPVYAGAGALAYGFGLRHAFDADHIAAVDDTTRLMLQRGGRPLSVGLFFSLGHSTIVFLLCLGLAISTRAIEGRMDGFSAVGGVIGGMVSGTFLWAVGILNLIVFWGIYRIYKEMRRGHYNKEHLEDLLVQRGFMNRLLGRRFRNAITRSWHMYPLGVVFGLGFDTATEVGLLAITAGAASTATNSGGGHIPVLGIIALPLLFTAGMTLMDTTDGVFMSKAYRWAFTNPLRKVYYNLTTTALSIFVALAVGTVQYLQVIQSQLNIENPFFTQLDRLDFATLGYGIIGVFVLTWIGAVVWFKVRRVEERWGDLIPEDH